MEPVKTEGGYGKIGASILAAFSASYIMTQFSLHGVNFEVLGFPSELVKSTIIGTLVGFFAWVTPRHLVQAIIDAILFFRLAFHECRDAANQPLEKEPPK